MNDYDIDWNACTVGRYSRYNARAKCTTYTPYGDAQVLVTLWGGRSFLTGAEPNIEMEYAGFMGSYKRDIDILKACPDRPWLFEAWYPTTQEIHTYAFHKVISITDRTTGVTIDGKELCRRLGGTMGGAQDKQI